MHWLLLHSWIFCKGPQSGRSYAWIYGYWCSMWCKNVWNQKQGSLRSNQCYNVLKLERRLLMLNKKLSRKSNSNIWRQIKKLGLHITTLLMCGCFLLRIIILKNSWWGQARLICHPVEQCHSFDSTIKSQKGFVTYNS
jgi:hypothetical protein